ncbi:hypothetical protein K227x_23580 [Rubripirellula lacrimiformis]|uniref:ImpA N-terminal domain-containing protein n=1 Tax=Rubripirellula lacrimiformis TaxID=1930273 RepID=A0A517NA17_9BACT|nr:type VI secretion system protein TssA [Rubripirellula lacrimiformis]QDT03972.1 hypothetical protein K227x_23580 [Rubripirellula lacrimiformis]
MPAVERQSLTTSLSSNSPSGVNLEYDPRFVEMMRLSEGTREQQYGQTIIAAQGPEWNTIHQLASELATETRDLRVAVLLIETLTHREGLSGLADGLGLLRDWTCNFWSDIHPQLDASDNNDPFVRINSLGRLCEPERLLTMIGRIALVEAPPHVTVTVDDVRRSKGDSANIANADRPTPMEIEAAFLSLSVTELRQRYEVCQRADGSLCQTIEFLDQTIGTGAWDASTLMNKVAGCRDILKNQLRQRLSVSDAIIKDVSSNTNQATSGEEVRDDWNPDDVDHSIPEITRIRVESREDAAHVLQAAIKYFEQHEPSSPVPLLLRRASRLINQDFVGIIRELAPDALAQARNLAGDFDE